ncbi:DEAD/DEAH box helicase [Paenibacillus sp. AR247]|uniref:DEAD/DEAH box helicase n=1 Tax=Paenibacillus sp. AR247 TaxID=1631599 RepID=UPI000CF8E754|nr:DEAD/DEAH box helicase family protein [Paenibacillus sp. AR247]
MENQSKAFPDHIKFRYPWRSYQKRILDRLDEHLRNRHLHLVAPPGSGKTVLGLEVMLRINRPTIILAPTLTIKEQWANRFMEQFLDTDIRPDWLSTSIHHPAMVTITTYQALHTVLTAAGKKDEEQGDKQSTVLSEHGLKTAVDDTEDAATERGSTPEEQEIPEDTDEAEKEDVVDQPSAAMEIIEKLKKLGLHTVIF